MDWRYSAFISYAHEDNREPGLRWADWLQGLISEFEVPERLVGSKTSEGEVRTRLRDVFVDRSHLSVGTKVDDTIEEPLVLSRFLVVICSPRSAESKYVALEIKRFAELHGTDRILPVLIEGDHHRGDRNCSLPEAIFEVFGGELPLFVDFRASDHGEKRRGWTDPDLLAKRLRQEREYAKPVRRNMVKIYSRDHQDAQGKLLSYLTGLSLSDVGVGLLQKANAVHRGIAVKYFRYLLGAGCLMVIALLGLGMLDGERRKARQAQETAEAERKRAERSLLMIGDAHDSATQLAGDLLVSLKKRKREAERPDDGSGSQVAQVLGEALTEARAVVESYYDAAQFGGFDEGLHMRSVILNSKGDLVRRLGDYAEAEDFFRTALDIRKDLWARNQESPLYLHDLAVSYDNLGDLHYDKAASSSRKSDEYVMALEYFRESLGLGQKLAQREDAPAYALNDVAVSHYKIGSVLFEAGQIREGLSELRKGFQLADKASAASPNYAKWEAHLGHYCLRLGEIYSALVQDEEAARYLERGRKIFVGLRKRDRLTPEYGGWLQEIEKLLEVVGGTPASQGLE